MAQQYQWSHHLQVDILVQVGILVQIGILDDKSKTSEVFSHQIGCTRVILGTYLKTEKQVHTQPSPNTIMRAVFKSVPALTKLKH